MTSSKNSELEIQLQQIENILDVVKQQLNGIKKYKLNVPVMELEMLQHNVSTLTKAVSNLPVEKQTEIKKKVEEVSKSASVVKEPEHNTEDLLSEIGVKVNEKPVAETPDVDSESYVHESLESKVSALSIHERIAEKHEDNSHATMHQTKKLDSLQSTIGLNEKFLFIKDLFHGKNELYVQAIKKLDDCSNMTEALDVIKHHIPNEIISEETEAYLQFVELLNRRYEA
ncbi:MAG: hypothetical protein KJO64_01520 [Bacteroidia bacterium]|nr:hypothetical protein [Bacteroidia bacterium]